MGSQSDAKAKVEPVGQALLARQASLSARNAEQQIGVVITLLVVIPLMITTGMTLVPDVFLVSGLALIVVLVCTVICAAIGLILLIRYALSITRIRRYLEAVVTGNASDRVNLPAQMSDVAVVENALRIVVDQLSHKAWQAEREVAEINDLLSRSAPDTIASERQEHRTVFFENETLLDEECFLVKCIGRDVLQELALDCVAPLDTGIVFYEENGRHILGCASSDWCRLLYGVGEEPSAAAGAVCLCRDWRDSDRISAAADDAQNCPVPCGLSCMYFPIKARGRVIGAVALSYGEPPASPTKLAELSRVLQVPVEEVERVAKTYKPRPRVILELARNRLRTTVTLIGQLVEHALDEEALIRERATLENAVRRRAEELEIANERLSEEVEERRRAEGLKDDFVSTVSHELRTPLAITKEGIELLLDEIPGSITEKQRKVLATAKGNMARLGRIINDLLDISKIEAGKMTLEKRKVDLVKTAVTVIESMKASARAKGLKLETEIEIPVAQVFADEDRMVQVFTNLIGNAMKFTDEGRITVRLWCEDSAVHCSVADTGVGLSDEDAAKVFEKFMQIGRTHGAGQKGTGLGLPIAKHILALHKGLIRIESELEKGTTFTFELPVFDDSAVLCELIDEAVEEARREQTAFTFLLFRFDPVDGGLLADHVVEEGIRKILRIQSLARDSDNLAQRGPNEIVMVASLELNQLTGLLRRWEHQAASCFSDVDPQLDLRMSCGYAEYPKDGSSAQELLEEADATVSVICESLKCTQMNIMEAAERKEADEEANTDHR